MIDSIYFNSLVNWCRLQICISRYWCLTSKRGGVV